MKWYLTALKNSFNFSGRARRQEYWWFKIFDCLIITAILFIFGGQELFKGGKIDFVEEMGTVGMAVFVIYVLLSRITTLAVIVRRLHDVNKPGIAMFIGLIPTIGQLWLFINMCKEGDRHPNAYGPDPKKDDKPATSIYTQLRS